MCIDFFGASYGRGSPSEQSLDRSGFNHSHLSPLTMIGRRGQTFHFRTRTHLWDLNIYYSRERILREKNVIWLNNYLCNKVSSQRPRQCKTLKKQSLKISYTLVSFQDGNLVTTCRLWCYCGSCVLDFQLVQISNWPCLHPGSCAFCPPPLQPPTTILVLAC